MDSQTANTIYLFGSLISLAVLICYFNMVINVAKAKRYQKAQMKTLFEMAMIAGVDEDAIDKIKTESLGIYR
jgi:hypothetical protein